MGLIYSVLHVKATVSLQRKSADNVAISPKSTKHKSFTLNSLKNHLCISCCEPGHSDKGKGMTALQWNKME